MLTRFSLICVGIYAFISGYGMCCTMQKIKNRGNPFGKQLCQTYLSIGKRMLIFLRKYWLVFCIFVPLGFALNVYQPGGIRLLLENFFAYRYDYNGNWWYVKEYLFLLLLAPYLDLFFDFLTQKEFRTLRVLGLLVVGGGIYAGGFLLFYELSTMFLYCIPIFTIGYICARFAVISKWKERIPAGAASYLLGGALLLAAFVLRTILARNSGHRGSDVVLAPVFCLAICFFTRKEGKITNAFAWLGKYSVYMWMTHYFYCGLYFKNFITFSHVSALMYLQLVAVSLLTSAALFFVETRLCKLCSHILHRKRDKQPA